MENNTEHYMNELEEMRWQMRILKQKLDDQQLVNDRLIRKAMSNKMSFVTKYVWFELLALFPFCVLVFTLNKLMYPTMTWYPTLAILLFLLIDILWDFYINRISENDWQSENLLQTADKLLKMKKMRWQQVAVALPFMILLLGWYLWEFPDEIRLYTTIGGIIGGVIGFSIGIRILLKMQRINDDLIRQIREIKCEEN